jgi:hypothetical protein
MHDLNALIPSDSPLYLLIAFGINDSGEIAGFGVQTSTDIHAFLAMLCDRNHADTDWCKDGADGAASEADKTVERPTVFLKKYKPRPREQGNPLLSFFGLSAPGLRAT